MKNVFLGTLPRLERVRGIEPLPPPWEGGVLPLYDTRI